MHEDFVGAASGLPPLASLSEATEMNDHDPNATYNYAEFVGDDDFLAFRTALPVGSQAPDVVVTVAESGAPARLSDYWRATHQVIEFGALT